MKRFRCRWIPLGQMSVQGMHILILFSSTSILLLGHARTHELWSTTKLSATTAQTPESHSVSLLLNKELHGTDVHCIRWRIKTGRLSCNEELYNHEKSITLLIFDFPSLINTVNFCSVAQQRMADGWTSAEPQWVSYRRTSRSSLQHQSPLSWRRSSQEVNRTAVCSLCLRLPRHSIHGFTFWAAPTQEVSGFI